jgi:cobalt-zinc-cadmium efflux system outer membrane protein
MKKSLFCETMTIIVLASFVLAGSAGRAAQSRGPGATVEDLVARALDANPEVLFYEAQIKAAEAGVRAAGRWKNPELDVQSGLKRAWSGAAYENGHVLYATLSQRIEFPKRIELRKAIANGDLRLARLGLEKFRMMIRNRIRAAVLRYQFAARKASTIGEVVGRAESLLEVLVQRDPAGVAPLLERRVIEAHLVRLRAQVRAEEQEVETQRTELNHLVQAPLDAPVELASMDPGLGGMIPITQLMTVAETNSFELLAHVAEIEQQGYRVRLERQSRWPGVTLSPFFNRETGAGPQNIVGLGLSLPLPIWNRNRPNIDAAKAREQQLEAAFRVTLRRLQRDLVRHAEGYAGALRQLEEWRPDAVEFFQQAADLGDRHYRLGAIEVSTYLELQGQYLEAVAALLDLRKDAFEHRLELELLTGMDLPQQR